MRFFRTAFLKNTYGGLLQHIYTITRNTFILSLNMFSFQFINIKSKLYFYKCTHFFLFLYLSGYNSSIPLLYGDSHPMMITLIPRIPTLIPRIPIIPTLILPISIIPTLVPRIPIIPILIPRIPINLTLIPRIPTLISGVRIIPLIPLPDCPFRLLQID